MKRASWWSRLVWAAVLPLVLLGASFVPAGTPAVDAVGCGNAPELPAPAAQAQERWRYVYDGGGSYQVVGWSPSEVTLLVNSPGCAISRIALVGLDLISGQERWRVTSDQWEGEANDGITTGSGLVILPTSDAVYAYDETTGQQLWSAASGYDWAPAIVADENNAIVLSYENALMALNEGTGALLWQQTLPTGSITDWQNIEGGPLVGIGRPANAGEDVLAFGIDKATGTILWQTVVGNTVSSFGGELGLDGNGTGLVVAKVQTDGTSALAALDGATGTIHWTAPIASDIAYGRVYLTRGAQPTVIYATGGSLEVKSATGYDAASGAQRWQNENIGTDAILADDTHLVGAGPTLSYLNALVSVDGETGEMVWAQPYALVDGGFPGTAAMSIDEVVFTPSLQEEPAPTIMAVDLATGNVNWSNAFPEFMGLYLDGVAADLPLATGETADEAVLIAFGS
ncbi:MAG TPA: PQQ-binding-like beta-propeller repeat protein [Thermomicrobiales bacterium]|nr:PQQ-binding-like beta-propeller repeat protein [Thermomicrobiales bacterium]